MKLGMDFTVCAIATRQGFSSLFVEKSRFYTSNPIVLVDMWY